MQRLLLILKLARRDLRGAFGSLWIAIAGISLGVAAIAAVGSLSAAMLESVRTEARDSIGGDVSLRLFHRPADPHQRRALEAAGRLSETAELRPMAQREDGTAMALVELKAVDGAYPLYGEVALDPPGALAGALASYDGIWGVAVDRALLETMEAEIGDRLRLGGAVFDIRAIIENEPDRSFRAFTLGPRVIIQRAALDATGLAPPGAPVYWYYRLRLPDPAAAAGWIASLEHRFPDAGWRIVNAADGVPGVERTLDIVRVLLMLVALAVLLVGGVGVASAVTAHLARKTTTVAIFRSLGASQRLAFAVLLAELGAVTALAVLLGLTLGSVIALAVPVLYPGIGLPVAAPDAVALAIAAVFGVLTALAFGLWSLARIHDLTPQHLFRTLVTPPRQRPLVPVVAAILAGGAMAALLMGIAGMPLIAGMFAGLAAVSVLALLGAAKGLAWAARRAPRRGPTLLRLALGNVSRPGAATGPVMMALGLGLTVLVVVATVDSHARRHLGEALPERAPDLFFLAIPPEQGAEFRSTLAGLAGVQRVEQMPFVHGRLTRINGIPIAQMRVPRDVAWLVRGDRGLSWVPAAPPGVHLAAGSWWDPEYRGPPLASVDARVARRLNLGIGDRLTLDLLGAPVEAEIVNLRTVDWTALDLDFPILLSPPQSVPPHTEVAAVWTAAEAAPRVAEAMAERFPASPHVRVEAVLATIGGMIARLAAVLSIASAAVIVAAVVVLAGSLAATWQRRVDEMVLMTTLGGSRRQLAGAAALEMAVLGLATAVIATALGTAAAYLVVGRIAPEAWALQPAVPALVVAMVLLLMAAAGWLLPQRALTRSPATLLRARFPAD